MRTDNQHGVAMISVLLVMMLVSALLIGFTAMTMSDQRFRFIDRDRNQSFYAAAAGLEKLTADLGNLFFVYVAPTAGQITALTTNPPTIPKISFTKSDGTSGYQIASQYLGSTTISTGPYQGLYALITQYTMDVTARTATGGDTHLQRVTETVAIPVFQFGIFSDVDLSFFAGPNFNFGGRVHTNGNLFLSEGGGSTLTLSDKVTAVKEVVRQRLQNGALIGTAPAHDGTVSVTKGGGAFRNLAANEGSVVDGLGSALNEPPASLVSWTNLSLSTYNANIRNGKTGARVLNLPLITMGGTNVDLTKRPLVGEDVTNPTVYGERDYGKVSLRIMLSDKAADITGLPGVTAAAPVSLEPGAWPPAGYPVNGAPIARSLGPLPVATTVPAITPAGSTTLTVNALPAWMVKPQITVKNAAGTTIVGPFTCTTWTATQFQGCTVPAALTTGWTIYVSSPAGTATLGPGNMPGNPNPSVTLNGAVAAGPGRTLSLNAGQTTWGFAANTFWVNDVGAGGTGLSTLVTCTGATGVQFTGCTGIPTVPAAGAFRANATVTTGYQTPQAMGTIGGFIKAELQKADGTWVDVTMELLNYGIGGPNLAGSICADPTPNAILRIQRLRDNAPGTASCPSIASNVYEWWPNTLFDTREALVRDNAPASGKVTLAGTMHYIGIDATNLANYFKGNGVYAGGQGVNAITNNGYSVYFSDRRNNRDAASKETGEFGWEDFVNPASAVGAPNALLDTGEDVNASGTLDVYGQFPAYLGTASTVPPGSVAPLDVNARPWTEITSAQAQVNRAILFRRALKVFNGSTLGPIVNGLTFVSENPVYVQGNWNANCACAEVHAATAVMGDAVTLLSNSWNDSNAFANPYSVGNRNRNTQTFYRLAIVSGKGMAFPQPAGTATDFGTDGGAHNFLRYLENGDQAVNYQGSIVTFYYNRQGVGTFKCCNTVYGAPTRNYSFDTDFLDPAKLPPLTPVFRDVNTIGFSQEIRPGR